MSPCSESPPRWGGVWPAAKVMPRSSSLRARVCRARPRHASSIVDRSHAEKEVVPRCRQKISRPTPIPARYVYGVAEAELNVGGQVRDPLAVPGPRRLVCVEGQNSVASGHDVKQVRAVLVRHAARFGACRDIEELARFRRIPTWVADAQRGALGLRVQQHPLWQHRIVETNDLGRRLVTTCRDEIDLWARCTPMRKRVFIGSLRELSQHLSGSRSNDDGSVHL